MSNHEHRPASQTGRRGRRCLGAVASALLVVTLSSPAFAGVGIFGEYGRNIATSGGERGLALTLTGLSTEFFDRNDITVGVAFDSNLARDRLFNSRTDIGFHAALYADPTSSAVMGTGLGGSLAWTLGLGLVRSEQMRLWLGPNLRLNADWYDASLFNTAGDHADLQLGFGPQIGLNLHTGDSATVTISGVYNYKWGWNFLPDVSAGGTIPIGTISHRDHYLGINVAFFWRGGGDKFE